MSKGEKTRRRIIAKAAPLFNRKGFESCSMQEISAATGLEKGSLYSHFETKEELALAAFDYAWSECSTARTGNLDQAGNSVDKLKLHIDNCITLPPFAGGCPMLNTAIDTDDGNVVLRRRAQNALRGWVSFLTQIIEEGKDKGEIKASVDAGALSTLIISLVEGAFMASKLQKSKGPMLIVQQHLNAHLEIQVRV
jgi:TetR/AcrR family transcriptional regulator, transcriptional repressor for nem operon